jgi:imidazolonepropionase-like amidohydrolase
VRVFDPEAGKLSPPVSVVVSGKRIAALDSANAPSTEGEVVFDGAGGTLVAGLFDMHAHLDQDSALLNVAAGVTSVRDMGNDKRRLDGLIARIESGAIGGPRVTRSGFIEGKSQFNANAGIVVASEARRSTPCAGTPRAATGRSRFTTA